MSSALIGISSCVHVYVRHLYVHVQPANLCLRTSNSILSEWREGNGHNLHKNIVRWAGNEQNLLAVCAGAGENHLTWAVCIT